MTNEYSVACVLDNASIEHLVSNISFLEKENYPHISLFQFKCNDANLLRVFKENIKNLFVSKNFLTTRISLVEKNIFLNIADDSTLQAASDQLADLYAAHTSVKEYLSQIDFSELSADQAAMTKKFGIYWVKKFFEPHVTLSYEKYFNEDLHVKMPASVNVLHPDIYQIDRLGRISFDRTNLLIVDNL